MSRRRVTPSTSDDPIAATICALQAPQRWSELPIEELSQLLVHACLVHAFQPGRWHTELRALYEVACNRLTSDDRLAALVNVGLIVERLHRSAPPVDAFGLTSALAPFLNVDPDARVVSTAALQLAVLLPLQNDDPVTGPRLVLDRLLREDDEDRRMAILTGLLALGDRRLIDVLAGHWAALIPDRATADLIAHHGYLTAFEAILNWFGTPEVLADESHFGALVPALEHLGHAAAANGLVELSRVLPVTAAADAPVSIVRTWTIDELRPQVAAQVAPRAAGESYPRLIPAALRAWGIEDAAYVDHIIERLPQPLAKGALLAEPVALDVLPDWDRPDAILEWWYFNPFGPTRKQVLATALPDGRGTAIVLAQHHFLEHFALLVAVTESDPPADVIRSILLDLFAGNGVLGQRVCGSLPTVIDLHDAIDVPFAARLFREAQQSARDAGLHQPETIADAIAHSRRTGDDPWSAAREEFAAAARAFRDNTLPAPADGMTEPVSRYVRWCRVASDARRVATVRREFVPAWAGAARSFNGSAFAGGGDDAEG